MYICLSAVILQSGIASSAIRSAASSVLRFAALLLLYVAEARAAGELEQELHCSRMEFADAVVCCVRWCVAEAGLHPADKYTSVLIPCLAGDVITGRWRLWCFLLCGVVCVINFIVLLCREEFVGK